MSRLIGYHSVGCIWVSVTMVIFFFKVIVAFNTVQTAAMCRGMARANNAHNYD